jgi:hypothetical protein
MSVTVDLQVTFRTVFVGKIIVIYLRTKLDMPSPSGSLFIAIKPKTKNELHEGVMLFFHITQEIP